MRTSFEDNQNLESYLQTFTVGRVARDAVLEDPFEPIRELSAMSGQHSRNIRRLVVEIERLSDAHKKPWAEKYPYLASIVAPIISSVITTLVLYMLFQGNAGG